MVLLVYFVNDALFSPTLFAAPERVISYFTHPLLHAIAKSAKQVLADSSY